MPSASPGAASGPERASPTELISRDASGQPWKGAQRRWSLNMNSRSRQPELLIVGESDFGLAALNISKCPVFKKKKN